MAGRGVARLVATERGRMDGRAVSYDPVARRLPFALIS
ncbi:MAG: hypothetical protein AVDCRST_MAG19-929 [uncultured Thermomicrobiales bacterium]|uniref:Uncharacterized protein n=1 Tax=uncultured Thermomicrobiales bacterium TaxID=1645740 RepID=A0A6J4UNH8_9BACT|nr:MAG: hypothetical protein AVDCRST_MAG19-929 [uncultured Thermomicrobiales bacterium]